MNSRRASLRMPINRSLPGVRPSPAAMATGKADLTFGGAIRALQDEDDIPIRSQQRAPAIGRRLERAHRFGEPEYSDAEGREADRAGVTLAAAIDRRQRDPGWDLRLDRRRLAGLADQPGEPGAVGPDEHVGRDPRITNPHKPAHAGMHGEGVVDRAGWLRIDH